MFKTHSCLFIIPGIISLLDEECLRPGEATDATFLAKMNTHLAKHKHYFSYDTSSEGKVCKDSDLHVKMAAQ